MHLMYDMYLNNYIVGMDDMSDFPYLVRHIRNNGHKGNNMAKHAFSRYTMTDDEKARIKVTDQYLSGLLTPKDVITAFTLIVRK